MTLRTLDAYQTDLDEAFHVASCLSGASKDRSAYVYVTTDPEMAGPDGEGYIILRGEDPRNASINTAIWTHEYTVQRKKGKP